MPDIDIRVVSHDLPADLRLWWLDLDSAIASVDSGSSGTHSFTRVSTQRRDAARAILLQLIAERLGRTVTESEILTDSGGKPRLSGSSLDFNLAHAGGEALIGISSEVEVGVDLEIERPVPEAIAFAKEYLSASERGGWHRQPAIARDRWLLDCWTRKEACLKALGTGLACPPAAISAGAGPERLRVEATETGKCRTLLVTSLELPSGSPGAAAIVLSARE